MKSLIVLVSLLGAVVSRPSIGHVQYANDGRSYSYSFETPIAQTVFHQARYVQAVPTVSAVSTVSAVPVSHASSVFVAPAVRFGYGAVPVASVKHVEPANIQVSTDGFVLDTPEVAHAKAEHLAAVAQEASRASIDSNPINVPDYDTVEVGALSVAPVAAVAAAAPVIAAKAVHYEPANIQLSADGHVLDTYEVAQAKAEHLARFNAEAARSTGSVSYSGPSYVSYDVAQPVYNYASPVVAAKSVEVADIKVSADGHVLDTPEVAQAKAEHLARFDAEAARSTGSVSYSGPSYVSYDVAQPIYNYASPVVAAKRVEIADIKVSADGHVLDTPEVAQAKAEHFAQYANDAARAAAAVDDSGSYDDGSVSAQEGDSVSIVALKEAPVAHVAYTVSNDPPADIKVSNDGFVLDTPEVAQAKSAHLAEVARSHSEAAVSYSAPAYVSSYISPSVAYTSPTVAYTAVPVAHVQPKWLGPEADIRVKSDGYLEDTPEVQQARAEHLATRASIMANTQAESTVAGATVRYAGGYSLQGGQYLLDTPEVVAARAAHLQAHAAEAAKSAVSVKTHNYGQLVYRTPVYQRTLAPAFSYVYSSPAYRYLSYRYAPTAAPVALTADGQYLLDTPEVAAAKAEHLAAHVRARGY